MKDTNYRTLELFTALHAAVTVLVSGVAVLGSTILTILSAIKSNEFNTQDEAAIIHVIGWKE